jgi:hypothetical protein
MGLHARAKETNRTRERGICFVWPALVGVCDDGAGARGRGDVAAGGADGGAGRHVQRTGGGKHAVGVCDDGRYCVLITRTQGPGAFTSLLVR